MTIDRKRPGFCFSFAIAVVLFLASAFSTAALAGQVANRISGPVDASRVRPLANHHPMWANPSNNLGLVPRDSVLDQMTLVLARSPEQETALLKLLSDQQNPGSPDYHHWLTPDEMGERFGLSSDDIESVSAWLRSQGLQVASVAPGRTLIRFTGTAANSGAAFHTEFRYYSVNGKQRLSVSSDPMVPEALLPVIKAVRGLYTIDEKPLHRVQVATFDSPEATFGGSNFIAPADFATIYDLPSSAVTGAGVSIGVVGRSRTDFTDFANFRNLTNTTFPNPTEIIPTAFGGVDPGPALTAPPAAGVDTGDQSEATLDILRTGGTAPGATLLLVVATNASGGIAADAEYLIETVPVPAQVMSISFGACESEGGSAGVAFWNQLFQQAVAEGISVFVSSGDSGASGCDAAFTTPPASPSPNSPNYICSSSYATCVGGTEFNDTANPSAYWGSSNGPGLSTALSYIPEGAWNEPLNSSSFASQVAGSGGGVSAFVPTPSWQAGTGVPAARAGRYTPDVAFSASGHDGYFGCFAAGGADCVESFTVFSGTSAAAPGMAGVTALLDQSNGAQGNLNPGIYALSASTPSAFHDVTVATSGVVGCVVTTPSMCNNSIPGPDSQAGGQAGYLVDTGYDEVTGLGSLDVTVFLNNFPPESAANPLEFVPVTPCRVVDTRNPDGPFGGPGIAGGYSREFDIPNSACSIPSTAMAYSLNVTVVPNAELHYITVWPSGQPLPTVSTLNSLDGRIKANAAIVPAGTNGGVSVFAYDATQVILDIDGYFVPAGTASALAFYPVTPCRLVDTRNAGGPLGGPSIAGGTSRSFPLLSGTCGLPATAQAYSLNVTAVPHTILHYLTAWPTGQPLPVASTLNALTGTDTANAAIVPAGTGGAVSIFVYDSADVVLDVNGYFAPAATGGLSLYTVDPCRVLDTRNAAGAFSGDLTVAVETSPCPSPSTAQAYVLNATVVPSGPLPYITLWPNGEAEPVVSTLNAVDGAITSNMALVPTTNGSIDAFAYSLTQLILDTTGYFAP